MSYGFEARNLAGNIQIDGQHQNLILLSSGSATYSHYPSASGASKAASIPWNFQEHPEIVVSAHPRGRDSLHEVKLEDKIIIEYGNNYVTNEPESTPIDYAIYGINKGDYTPAGGYGMQVFNSEGVAVFDSRLPYLRIVGVVVFDVQAGGGLYEDAVITRVPNPYPANCYMFAPPNETESELVYQNSRTYYGCSVRLTSDGFIEVINPLGYSIPNYRLFLAAPP